MSNYRESIAIRRASVEVRMARMVPKSKIIMEMVRAHNVAPSTVEKDMDIIRKRWRKRTRRLEKDARRAREEIRASLRAAMDMAHENEDPKAVVAVARELADLDGLKEAKPVEVSVSGSLGHVVSGEGVEALKGFLTGGD